MKENKGRWTIVLLTCRDPAKDFRLPLAEELHLLGHKVFYIFLKRRPVVIDMDNSQEKRVFSLPKFLSFMRHNFSDHKPLTFQTLRSAKARRYPAPRVNPPPLYTLPKYG